MTDGTDGAVRVAVVAESDREAAALVDDLETAANVAVVRTVDSPPVDGDLEAVDCVVHDTADSEVGDEGGTRRYWRRSDVLYVPLVDTETWVSGTVFDAWNDHGSTGEDASVLPLPRPEEEEGAASVLGRYLREAVADRTGTETVPRHRMQTFLWNLAHDLLDAPTQDAILSRTCERLADSDFVDAAWVVEGSPDADVRTHAGCDGQRVRRVRERLRSGEDAPPWKQAVADRTTVVRSTAEWGGTAPIASVALVHRGIVYGVLTLTFEPETTTGPGAIEDALRNFGRTLGQALATAEMQAQGETVQGAIEQADPAIAIVDEEGVVEYVNAAFESVYGYAKSEAVGSPFEQFLPESVDGETLRSKVRSGSHWRRETVQYHKTGRRFYADLSVAAVPVEGGTRVKYVAVASDITTLKERERRLQVLNRVLRHNLRNDVSVIRNAAAHISDDEVTDPRPVAEIIVETADGLVATSEKVRDATEALDRAGGRQRVVLADLLRTVADDLEAAYDTGTVDVDVPDDLVLEAHWEQLELVFSNLVENGLEYGGEAPTVEVFLTARNAREETVCVAVSDDGPGIPDHELSVIETGHETALEHGSGLGLWLVESAVTTLGGELRFETDDAGTTVEVDLPGVVQDAVGDTDGDRQPR